MIRSVYTTSKCYDVESHNLLWKSIWILLINWLCYCYSTQLLHSAFCIFGSFIPKTWCGMWFWWMWMRGCGCGCFHFTLYFELYIMPYAYAFWLLCVSMSVLVVKLHLRIRIVTINKAFAHVLAFAITLAFYQYQGTRPISQRRVT